MKLELKEIISLLEEQKYIEKEVIDLKMNNISSSYNLAKQDFRFIENMEDVLETLCYVIEKLKDCQERIVERNKVDIRDL